MTAQILAFPCPALPEIYEAIHGHRTVREILMARRPAAVTGKTGRPPERWGSTEAALYARAAE